MERVHKKSLGLLYLEYKDTPLFAVGMFLVTLAVSVFLVLNFILPQIQKWSEMNEQVETTKQRIKIIRNNIQLVRSVDDAELDENILASTYALPVEKNFGGAMQTILGSAINSGVSLKTFAFTVGNIATTSAELQPDSSTQIGVEAIGDAIALKNFIAVLSERLPVAKVLGITPKEEDDSIANIAIEFPVKSLETVSFDKTTPLKPFTSEERELLRNLVARRASAEAELSTSSSVASDAALPAPF